MVGFPFTKNRFLWGCVSFVNLGYVSNSQMLSVKSLNCQIFNILFIFNPCLDSKL